MKHEQFRLPLTARSQQRPPVTFTHLVDVLVRQAHDGKPQQVIGVLVQLNQTNTQAVYAFKRCVGEALVNVNVNLTHAPQPYLDASARSTRSSPMTRAPSHFCHNSWEVNPLATQVQRQKYGTKAWSTVWCEHSAVRVLSWCAGVGHLLA